MQECVQFLLQGLVLTAALLKVNLHIHFRIFFSSRAFTVHGEKLNTVYYERFCQNVGLLFSQWPLNV